MHLDSNLTWTESREIVKGILYRLGAFALACSIGFAFIEGDLLFINPFLQITQFIGYPPPPSSAGFFAPLYVLVFIWINTTLFCLSVVFSYFGKKIDYVIIVFALFFCLASYPPYPNLGVVLIAAAGIGIGRIVKLIYKFIKLAYKSGLGEQSRSQLNLMPQISKKGLFWSIAIVPLIVALAILAAHPKDDAGVILLNPYLIFIAFDDFKTHWYLFFAASMFSSTFWSGFFYSFLKKRVFVIIPTALIIIGVWAFFIFTDLKSATLDPFTYIKLVFYPLSGYFLGSVFNEGVISILSFSKRGILYRILLIVPLFFSSLVLDTPFYFFNVYVFGYPPFDGIVGISQTVLIDYGAITASILAMGFLGNVVFGYLNTKIDYLMSLIFIIYGAYVYRGQEDVTQIMVVSFFIIAIAGFLLGRYLLRPVFKKVGLADTGLVT